MFQPGFSVRILDVEVVNRPVQCIASGLGGFGGLLVGGLLTLERFQAVLQLSFLAVGCGLDSLL